MILQSLGTLQIHNISSKKLSTQLLLLLSYVHIEGFQTRNHLAKLFWPHLAQEFTKKGERKDLNNLGVAISMIKKEISINIEDESDLAQLVQDSKAFIKPEQLENRLELLDNYKGQFLQDIENKPRPKIGNDLLEWILSTRAVSYTHLTLPTILLV